METLKVFFLAILQGITEFLPISSSGHLAICKNFMGLTSPGTRLEVMLHFGTLIAVIIYYWNKIWNIILGLFQGKRESIQDAIHIILACIPAIILYFLFGDFIEEKFDSDPRFPQKMLIVTGLLLTSLRFINPKSTSPITWPRALLIGIAQAIAMLPGISRSGSTIATARILNIPSNPAADFSFLISLPLLAGAAILELFHTPPPTEPQLSWSLILPATLLSAIIGYLSIKFLMRTITSDKFWLFGPYCLIAGSLTLLLS